MLWLCLRLPLLPLDVFVQNNLAETITAHQPAATMERHRVLVCNTSAAEMGVKPGMSLTTAQALCSEARIFEQDTGRESHALQTLAYSCYRFTPTVVLCPPDSLLLEIGGCLKLFRGLQRLLKMINQTAIDHGHKHMVGFAPTPKAAALLSCVELTHIEPNHVEMNSLTFFNPTTGALNSKETFEQYLHALPLAALDCSKQLKDKFRATGFNCLGDLLRLPNAALGKRYGKDFLVYLKQLTGEQADPQQAIELPPQFEGTLEFNDGIISTEMLAFPMKHLLLSLSGYLHGRQLHCSQIRWVMGLSSIGLSSSGSSSMELGGKNTREIILHFAQPHNSLEHFLSMSRLKLDNLVLRSPIESLSLYAERLHQAEQKNVDLFGPQADSISSNNEHINNGHSNNDNLVMILDKLRTRLGEDSVYGLDVADSHIPEQAWQTAPLNSITRSKIPAVSTASALSSTSNKPPTRPLWLLQNPTPVRVSGQRLYWRGELELLQGPERIEGNWWQAAISRDYFVARHHNGALYWLYRDRLDNSWFIHGLFG